MKLFQKLLLAPATLGLFAPIVANANESNFRDVTSYSQDQVEVSLDTFKPLSNKNPLLAGGEGANSSLSDNDFDVDSFNSTTTASFTSNFALGTVEGTSTNSDDSVMMNYDYEIALSSSFTDNDSLEVVLNAGKSTVMPELDMTNTSSKLQIDTITYTKQLGDRVTVFFGEGDGSAGSTLYNTACVYGAVTDTFSNCGVASINLDEGFGTALGANFDFGNGFSAAVGYEGQGMSNVGLLTKEGKDAHGIQLAYTGDTLGVSVSWANIEKDTGDGALPINRKVGVAINGFYQPDIANFPSISAGLESVKLDHGHVPAITDDNDEESHYFLGLQWDEFAGGTLGAAMGSKEPYSQNEDAQTMYEVYYTYNYADGITITPLLYSKDNSGSTPDETGLIVKTTFSF